MGQGRQHTRPVLPTGAQNLPSTTVSLVIVPRWGRVGSTYIRQNQTVPHRRKEGGNALGDRLLMWCCPPCCKSRALYEGMIRLECIDHV